MPPSADTFATEFEQHSRVMRRQAGRLLRGTGVDPDDVLQDVYLRAHAAMETGVVPIEPRAWLLRMVRNACVDELRRVKARPVGDVTLDAVPSFAGGLPDEVSARAEARALLADMQRLPDRQKSVLVLNALDGLSHEEVADRLDTTVHTTRSLLARARANLRQTAEARETSCASVELALEEAALAGVRASELARRHLWSCAGCRAFQHDLRVSPSRLRRLASWSPWALAVQLLGGGSKAAVGMCCALVFGGGAVTVPVVEHAVHGPSVPESLVADVASPVPAVKPPRRKVASARTPVAVVATPASDPVSAPPSSKPSAPAPAATKKTPAARRTVSRRVVVYGNRAEERQFAMAIRAFINREPTDDERREVLAMIRTFRATPKDSRARTRLLRNIQRKAFTRPPIPVTTPSPTATAAPPTPTPTPEPPAPTPTSTPVPTPSATPSPAPPDPIATP